MRQVETTIGSAPVSAIGFGCASLGSRIGRSASDAALEQSLAAGITWFDVAPSYGDGNAEAILGAFAARHPGAVNICTKVGILARPAGWKALVRPIARGVIKAVPSMRGYATAARTVAHLPLTPEGITRSVDNSLVRLGKERLDLLMLHDPLAADVVGDEVLVTLEGLKAAGKVAVVGVAGDLAAARLAATRPETYAALQFANNPYEPNAQADFLPAWRAAGRLVITHSALGAHGALLRLAIQLRDDAETARLLAISGYEGNAGAASFLTDYALATNPQGVTLFSAATPHHLTALVTRTATDGQELRALAVTVAARSAVAAKRS